jgi:hypothetical protein
MRRSTAAVLAGLLLLAGCGDASGPAAGSSEGGAEPTTPEALAAVASEYAGAPSSATAERVLDEYDEGAVGARLRYDADGEGDGDMLAVAVGTGLPRSLFSCHTGAFDGCEEAEGGTLAWEDHEPEEDPGVVYVAVEKGEVTVLVMQTGPTVDKDPRALELAVSVDDMFAIAHDDRVDLTTSRATIDAGEALDAWQESTEG